MERGEGRGKREFFFFFSFFKFGIGGRGGDGILLRGRKMNDGRRDIMFGHYIY